MKIAYSNYKYMEMNCRYKKVMKYQIDLPKQSRLIKVSALLYSIAEYFIHNTHIL